MWHCSGLIQPLMWIGMAMGQGRFEGWGLRPRPAWFFLIHPHLALHDGENFLTPSLPLGAPRRPTPPHKTLLLVNLPSTITIVFNKTCFVSKNILEITNKLIPSNQTNFQQKLNNIIKVFNKTISQQKQKSHNTKSMIQQYIKFFIIKTKENVNIGILFPIFL